VSRFESRQGGEHCGVPFGRVQVADRQHEWSAGQQLAGGDLLEARHAVEHGVQPLGGDDAFESAGDRAADGHDRGGAGERADGLFPYRARSPEVDVDVGAVDGDDVGDAEVVGEQARRRTVGICLVGVDEVEPSVRSFASSGRRPR